MSFISINRVLLNSCRIQKELPNRTIHFNQTIAGAQVISFPEFVMEQEPYNTVLRV